LTSGEVAAEMGISVDDVNYWSRVKRPSTARYVPDLSPRPDLAYLLSAYLGDGRTAGEQDKKVRFNVADPAFADTLNDLVAKVLRAAPKKVTLEYGFYSVSYDAAVLYDYLQQPLQGHMSLIESFPGMFLRGFFDAEGYVSPILDHSEKELRGVIVGVANTNSEYLSCVQGILVRFGISSSDFKTHETGEEMTIRGRTFVRRHAVHQLRITKKSDIRLFQTHVDFSIPAKKQKLEDLIRITRDLDRADGYRWFLSHYELRSRKWVRVARDD
jgi:intein-encoded DNA endonuclease-like protein